MLNRREFLKAISVPCASALFLPDQVSADDQKENYIILMIIDGARSDIVYDMIKKGLLPNIKKHLFDNGTYVQNAITGFPTLTLALHPTIMTGYFPGHHGINSNVWFDRKTRESRDYCSNAVDVLKYPTDLTPIFTDGKSVIIKP